MTILDLFSLPIQFTLGDNQKAKRTLFGGILTVIIGVVSLTYFIYLCNIYFSNQIQPTISTTNKYFKNELEMDIDEDMIGFRIILQDGEYLQDVESKMGKKYISFITSYFNTEGDNPSSDDFLSTPCKNESLQGYMCIKMKSINSLKEYQSLKLKYTESNEPQNSFNLSVARCDQSIEKEDICESDDDIIKNAIFNLGTSFQVKILTKQYNPITKDFDQKIQQENYLFDDTLAFVSTFQFQNVQTSINDGFLIQSTKVVNNFSEYIKTDSTLSQQYLKRTQQRDIYGGFFFTLGTLNIVQSIQYTQFTSILAQFISVLNSLLVVGVICRKLAEFEIMQELLSIQLKVYYKKTALSIINQKNSQVYSEQKNKYSLLKLIQDSNIKQKIYDYFKVDFISRIKMSMLFQREVKQKRDDPNEMKSYKQLLQLSQKSLNIYQLQEELLKIKMMLKLIFTAEQYAAIQLCGCQIQDKESKFKFENKNNQNQIQLLNKDAENSKHNFFEDNLKPNQIQVNKLIAVKTKVNNLDSPSTQRQMIESPKERISVLSLVQEDTIQNHLEAIEQIENDSTLLSLYINKFLAENKQPQSELNKRILQSMIGIENINENDKL